MSRPRVASMQPSPRFPRVSGDEPSPAYMAFRATVFSPRERG